MIAIEDVTFHFGKVLALDNLTLKVLPGLSMGLLGPNGAGKSTLIRILVGLLKPQRGSIHVFGEPPSITNTSRIGYMPQLSALYRELSAMENVDFFARMYGLRSKQRRRERVEEVIRLVNLWERRNDPLLHLSGGMRQRVSLACAIVHSPPLLLLDEPTVGLDPELRVSFWEYFHKLTASGVTLVISSHTMDDAAHCDRLVFLRTGRLIAEGTPQGLCQATGRAEATLEEAFLYFIRRK